MTPENLQHMPKEPFEAAATPKDSTPTTPPETASNGHFEAQNGPKKPIRGILIGAVFLAISILGGVGLILAYMPRFAPSEPEAQAAAAVTTERPDFFKDLTVSAEGVFVYDIKNDTELFTKNATVQLPLASITKMMLVLVVSEVLEMESHITISHEAVERGGGGLTWGEEWRVRDLIDYTLITSSNTGAEALAEAANPLLAAKYPAGSQLNATIWRMNALAQAIGMDETYFINATGLDESTTQAGAQSSARDVAKIFAYALRTNRSLFAGTMRTDVVLGPKNAPERYAHNTNNALADIEGLIMGKTGTTDLAGGNLAIAFNAAADHPIVIVVLNATPAGRFDDIRKLAEAARKTVAQNQ